MTETQILQHRTNRLISIAVILAALCVLIALVTLGLVLFSQNATVRTTDRKVDRLIDAEDRGACLEQFVLTKHDQLVVYLTAINDVDVAIGTGKTQPEITAKIVLADDALAAYNQKVADRKAWEKAGSPLPCPIGPG